MIQAFNQKQSRSNTIELTSVLKRNQIRSLVPGQTQQEVFQIQNMHNPQSSPHNRHSLPMNLQRNSIFRQAFVWKYSTTTCTTRDSIILPKKASTLKMTLMILTLPISYLLTTLPIFLIISFKLLNFYFKMKMNLEVEFAFAKILMLLNNSINILCFIFFGKNLRRDFLRILAVGKLKKRYSSSKYQSGFHESMTLAYMLPLRNKSIL